EAPHAGGFPWRPETSGDDANLAEPDQHGRRSWHGGEQVELGGGACPQHKSALHAYVSRAFRFHTRRNAECHAPDIRAHRFATNGDGYALSATGDVCRLRSAAPDAVR